jgi:hypothetical protein
MMVMNGENEAVFKISYSGRVDCLYLRDIVNA